MLISLGRIFLMCLCALLIGCNSSETEKYDGVFTQPTTGEETGFAGLSSITQKTDSTLRLNWTASAKAVSYGIFAVSNGSSVLLTTVNGQSSSFIDISGLTPTQSYTFRVRLKTQAGLYDSNTSDLSVTMNAAPDAPTLIELSSPSSSPSGVSTPTLKVSGVKKDDTIKLFKDALCTQEIGSGVAQGPTVLITTSAFSFGTYVINASATNSAGSSSACSTSTVSYSMNAISYAGLTSVTSKTDSTAVLTWPTHPNASSYDIYNLASGSSVLMTNVPGQSSTSTTLSGLTPGGNYIFRVRMKTATGETDGNVNDVTTVMNESPDVPTGVTLSSPSTTPSNVTTPQIQVGGVKVGDTVKLYRDASCTTKVGEGVASGTTIIITSSTLSAGSYRFYATASNSLYSSGCSTAYASYDLVSCPQNYIPVSKNTSLGVLNDFCVAKFEMKNVGGVAVSQAASAPWATINISASRTACRALGTGYDLLSNPEWMTIAYSIESVASNWSGSAVGSGALYRGHSDSSPSGPSAITDVSNPYSDTGNTAAQTMGGGKEQRRTLTLANGEVIWDFSGNVSEWVNWSLGSTLTLGPGSCAAAWTQLPSVSCAALQAADYVPGNPGGVSSASYNSSYGIGLLYGGSGGAGLRGGRWSDGVNAGIFSLYLAYGTLNASSNMGFRCVFRP